MYIILSLIIFPICFIVMFIGFLFIYIPSNFKKIPSPPPLRLNQKQQENNNKQTKPNEEILTGKQLNDDQWLSVHSTAKNLKSTCVVVLNSKEEKLGEFSVDDENILIKVNNQNYKSKINITEITNIYFKKAKIHKNNFLRLYNPKNVIPGHDTICIRFLQGYEFEFWYYYLKSYQEGRKKYSSGDEYFSLLFQTLDELPGDNVSADQWLRFFNFFVGKLFYVNSCNAILKEKMRSSLSRKLSKINNKFISDITCSNCSFGHDAPFIKSITTHIPKQSQGRCILDGDVEYNGCMFIEIKANINIPIIHKTIPISLLLSFTHLDGLCRILFGDFPSKNVYVSFHTMPNVTVNYQFRYGEYYFIPSNFMNMIVNFIVQFMITQQLLLPTMLQVTIPQMGLVSKATEIETYNPFSRDNYKLPDLAVMSKKVDLQPYKRNILPKEEEKIFASNYSSLRNSSNQTTKRTGKFSFTQNIAMKFFGDSMI